MILGTMVLLYAADNLLEQRLNAIEVSFNETCVTCSCNRGGDCECLCTALANFVEACHSVGVIVNWRSQKLCRKNDFFIYLLYNLIRKHQHFP